MSVLNRCMSCCGCGGREDLINAFLGDTTFFHDTQTSLDIIFNLFTKYDADGNHKLEGDEIGAFFSEMYDVLHNHGSDQKMTGHKEQKIQEWMNVFDSDGDGEIDISEFYAAVTHMYQNRGQDTHVDMRIKCCVSEENSFSLKSIMPHEITWNLSLVFFMLFYVVATPLLPLFADDEFHWAVAVAWIVDLFVWVEVVQLIRDKWNMMTPTEDGEGSVANTTPGAGAGEAVNNNNNSTRIIWILLSCSYYICAHFPLDIFLLGGDHGWNIVYWVRMFRLLHVIRFSHYTQWGCLKLFPKSMLVHNPIIQLVLKRVFAILVCTHLAACTFYWLGLKHYHEGKNNWISAYEGNYMPDFMDSPYNEKYVVSLYFSTYTITGLGYGDISPTNSEEVVFVCFLMGFGLFNYMYIVGALVTLLLSVTKARFEWLATGEIVKHFLENKKAAPEIHQRIIKRYEYMWNYSSGTDEDAIIHKELPAGFRFEMIDTLIGTAFQKVFFLEGAPDGFLMGLIQNLHMTLYGPGDDILVHGELNHPLFILYSGFLRKLNENGSVLGSIVKGQCFGDQTFLLKHAPAMETVRATEFSVCFYITPETFGRVMRPFMGFLRKLESHAEKAARRINEATQSHHRVASNELLRSDTTQHYAPYAILPESDFRYRWDILSMLGYMYYAIFIPLRIGFFVPDDMGGADWFWMLIDWIIDIFFIVDIYYRLRYFAIISLEREVYDRREQFARRYLKGYFVFDVLSSLPMEMLAPAFDFRYFYFFRINRMIRFFVHWYPNHQSFLSYLAKQKGVTMGFKFFLMRLFVVIIYFIHLAGSFLYTEAWIQEYNGGISWYSVDTDNTNIPKSQSAYIRSVYYALLTMTTVGYGGIVPVNHVERCLHILFVFLATGIFFFMSANLSAIADNQNSRSVEYERKLEVLKQFIQTRNLPQDLIDRIFAYYRYMWSMQRGYTDNEQLDKLPRHLRVLVLRSLTHSVIKTVPTLKDVPNAFLNNLMARLDLATFAPYDTILVQGDPISETYFVLSGIIDVLDDEDDSSGSSNVEQITDGGVLGQECLMYDEVTSKYTYRADRMSFVSMASLTKDRFNELLKVYPNVRKQVFSKRRTSVQLDYTGFEAKRATPTSSSAKKRKTLHNSFFKIHGNQNKLGMYNPDSVFLTRWSVTSFCLLVYYMVVIPMRIAFDVGWVNASFFLDTVADIFFLVDMYFRMTRFSVYQDGKLVTDPSELRKIYKSTMPLDIIGTLFFDILLYWISRDLLAWFRITRMVHLHRLSTYLSAIKLMLVHVNTTVLQIGEMFGALLVTLHWFSCGWVYLGHTENSSTNWQNLDLYLLNQSTGGFEATYWEALYFITVTVGTVGYGDLKPLTLAETLFGVLVMLVGCFMYDMFMGTMASLAAHIDVTEDSFRTRVDRIEKYLDSCTEIDPDLIRRINKYYSGLWTSSKGVTEESVILDLPVTLRSAVTLFLHQNVTKDLPLFEGLEESFVRRVACHFVERTFYKGDYILLRSHVSHSMYIVREGRAIVQNGKATDPRAQVLHHLGKGSVFGEDNLRNDHPKSQNFNIIVSVKYCVVLELNFESIRYLFALYPFAREMLIHNIDQAILDKMQKIKSYRILKKHLTKFCGQKTSMLRQFKRRVAAVEPDVTFYPNDRFTLLWQSFSLVFCFFYVSFIPVHISFINKTDGSDHTPFWVLCALSWMIDSFFWVDVYLHATTFAPSVHDTDRANIKAAWKSDKKGRVMDFIRIAPFDLLAAASGSLNAVSILRVLRLLILKRVPSFIRSLDKLIDQTFKVKQKLRHMLWFFVTVGAVIHLVACFLFFVGDPSIDTPSGNSWHYLRNGQIVDAELIEQFLLSLYFALATITTTGYGDLSATRTREIYFILVSILVSAVVNASMIGSISSYTAYELEKHTDFSIKFNNLRRFMIAHNTPKGLMDRILKWKEYTYSHDTIMSGWETLQMLPFEFRKAVAYSQYGHLISSIGKFLQNNEGLMSTMASYMRPQVHMPGEYLLMADTVSTELLFLHKGQVEILLLHPPKSSSAASAPQPSTLKQARLSRIGDLRQAGRGSHSFGAIELDRLPTDEKKHTTREVKTKSKSKSKSKAAARKYRPNQDQDESIDPLPRHGFRASPRIILDRHDKAYFGEVSFFLFTTTTAHIVSRTHTELMSLTREDWDRCIMSYPDLQDSITEKVKKSLNYLDDDMNLVAPPVFDFNFQFTERKSKRASIHFEDEVHGGHHGTAALPAEPEPLNLDCLSTQPHFGGKYPRYSTSHGSGIRTTDSDGDETPTHKPLLPTGEKRSSTFFSIASQSSDKTPTSPGSPNRIFIGLKNAVNGDNNRTVPLPHSRNSDPNVTATLLTPDGNRSNDNDPNDSSSRHLALPSMNNFEPPPLPNFHYDDDDHHDDSFDDSLMDYLSDGDLPSESVLEESHSNGRFGLPLLPPLDHPSETDDKKKNNNTQANVATMKGKPFQNLSVLIPEKEMADGKDGKTGKDSAGSPSSNKTGYFQNGIFLPHLKRKRTGFMGIHAVAQLDSALMLLEARRRVW